MAVLVRSGQTHIPPLRRALAAAGVPVEVASDDLPLTRDPAVRPLLDALRPVLHLDDPDTESVDFVDAGRAEGLLLSPLGGLDAGDVRVLLRLLPPAGEGARGGRGATAGARRATCCAGRSWSRASSTGSTAPRPPRARALARLLRGASDRLRASAPAEEILWDLWAGTSWPQRLRRSVDLGGGAARRAHRDLDSLCALFETAARAEERTDHLGVREFLDSLLAQQIPADTLAERGVRGSAVRLLTAHRSKGLEWDLVVVAHVQQESWPDLRRRSTLLRSDRIDSDAGRAELVEPLTPRELLKEERRLFYVACTRARSRLVVTAVASADDEGEQPSRFLDELAGLGGPRRRPAAAAAVAGRAWSPTSGAPSPTRRRPSRSARPLRRRLARLAAGTDRASGRSCRRPTPPRGGAPVPRRVPTRPVRDPERPVPVSASLLDAVATCPTHWFLRAEAGGVAVAHQSANLGQIVHALAERVASGDLPPDLDALMVRGRRGSGSGSPSARRGRRPASTTGCRRRSRGSSRGTRPTRVRWSRSRPASAPRWSSTRGSGSGSTATPTGSRSTPTATSWSSTSRPAAPRPAGRPWPVTGSSGSTSTPWRQGAFESRTPVRTAGGAELVQLGLTDGGDTAKVQAQDAQHDGDPRREVLRLEMERAAAYLREESFPAVAGQHCRECAFVSLCPVKGAGSVTVQ